ncbi:SulP family inorganic anion transporter [Caldimonas sp. KR1-144]|uniref:SulP family inorganic anion transporter n=1 Tax=Caldimonas sp. KR1-144 TaxID=3400911 RepID=UPI003C09A4C4
MSRRAARLFGGWVGELSRETLRADLMAGLLGALLVLPQGIAFASLAGLPPQIGLTTAVLPAVIAALFGSSRHVATGPSNATSLALAAMLAPLAVAGSASYIELAFAVTLLVGVLQTAVGALRLGGIANFISPAALLGFTTGAALLIALHALPDLLGVTVDAHGSAAFLAALAQQLELAKPGPLLVGGVTLAAAVAVRRLQPRWPAMLIALAAGTLLASALPPGEAWRVAQVGQVPAPLPMLHWPAVDASRWFELMGLALPLALVALAQSISIAKVIGARSGQRIDANREFLGQGLANLVGGLTSSYIACGSMNRSLPNYEAGARTPLASVFAAVLLLALALASAPLLALIPLASIAALLLLVAFNLLELPQWRRLARLERSDLAIAAATALATITLRIEIAILLGSILSLGTYLLRTSKPAMRTMGFDSSDPNRPFVVVDGRSPADGALPECPQLKLLRMEGAVYFGAVAHVSDHLAALRAAPDAPKHLLVMSKSMNFIDLAAAQMWDEELQRRRAMGGDLHFHRPRPPVVDLWRRTGFLEALGPGHVHADKRSAIATIVPRLDAAICARCRVRVFFECADQPGASDQPSVLLSAPAP